VDLFLLWTRSGGGFACALAFATLIVSKTDTPTWLGWLVGAAAVGVALLGVVRVLPAITVWKRGLSIDGRVIALDERRSTGDGHRSLSTRVRYAFQLDGTEYAGASTWGNPSRTALLAVGGPIALCYDPESPARVFWDADLPIRMPPVASF